MKSITIPCDCGRKHVLKKEGTKIKHSVDESEVTKEKPVKEKGFLEMLFGSDDENEEGNEE